MDMAEFLVRESYFSASRQSAKEYGLDFDWYLWCGKRSPLFGREKMTTFERLYIDDSETWKEPQNPYYSLSR